MFQPLYAKFVLAVSSFLFVGILIWLRKKDRERQEQTAARDMKESANAASAMGRLAEQ